MVQVLDIAGQPIEVGDTVVYGVSNKYGYPLQMGEVLELVPYDDARSVPNPHYDKNLPTTYEWGIRRGIPNDNPRIIREEFVNYKIKVKEPDTVYKDEFGDEQTKPGKKKTLPDPGRFAVVKKG